MPFRTHLIPLMLAAAALSGCDMFGDSPEKIAALREADGRAIGGACRHAGRAIEDCYVLNRRADKAAVFAGWRDMNDYMRENKIDSVAPELTASRADARSPEPRADSGSVESAVPAVPGVVPGIDKGAIRPAPSKTRALDS